MSYVLVGRTREIGLRMALGAQAGNVRSLILRQGMILTLIGSLIGLTIAFSATQLLKSMLYGVSASDPLTFGVAITSVPRHSRRSNGGPARGITAADRPNKSKSRRLRL